MDEENIDSEPTVSAPQPSSQQTSFSSSFSQRPQRRGVIIRWVTILIIVGALIFAGVSLFRSLQGGKEEVESTSVPTPTVEPTEEPTPTSSPSTPTPTKKPAATPTKTATSSAVSSKGLTLKVLNGSGVAGKAAGARDFLAGLGYTVSSIGNADSEDYDKTVITITKAKEDKLSTLKKDLETKYAVGTTSATLSSSEGVDTVLIIGKQ